MHPTLFLNLMFSGMNSLCYQCLYREQTYLHWGLVVGVFGYRTLDLGVQAEQPRPDARVLATLSPPHVLLVPESSAGKHQDTHHSTVHSRSHQGLDCAQQVQNRLKMLLL
jgi:hypothetical protein